MQARAAVLTAAQCATYNESKKLWMWITGAGDDFTTHLGSSMITGLVTTTATGPVDVIKTNMFVGEPAPAPTVFSHAFALTAALGQLGRAVISMQLMALSSQCSNLQRF